MHSDGGNIREAAESSFRVHNNTNFRFFSWSPSEKNIYYAPSQSNSSKLYSNEVLDHQILAVDLGINMPTGNKMIYKTINPSGSHVVLKSGDDNTYYPVQIKPTPKLLDDGWSYNRGQGSDYGGGYSDRHDLMFPDPKGEWFIHMTGSSIGAFWKMNLTGSGLDGGPNYNRLTSHFNERECEIMWTRNADRPNFQANDEWASHPGYDRWGRLVAWGQVADIDGRSDGTDTIWDYKNRRYEYSKSNVSYGAHNYPRNYTDWSAWSDYVAVGESVDNFVFAFNYSKRSSEGDFWRIAKHHGNLHGNSSYEFQNPHRVGQSPDGTKVNYIVEFLVGSAGEADIAYAVANYPHPPEITDVSTTSGHVTVRFDWQNGISDSNPRTYTKRGWPDESISDRPIPRETKYFRLWRSSDNISWTTVGKVDAEPFKRFDFVNGGFKSGQNSYWEINDTPGSGSWYYAVTSVENSGLESRTLSNVFYITVSDSNSSGQQHSVYPSNPREDSKFYVSNPPQPLEAVFSYKNSSASEDGQYTISWDEPNENQLIRYYNIYAADGATPDATQQNRIASIPSSLSVNGSFFWVDWLGNYNGSTKYAVTSVDSQGNESNLSVGNPGEIEPPNYELPYAPTNLQILD
ncbi:MAG: hypothetical protein HOK84_14395 [Bacteroidetes bacterium]|nr:hypothetical protein [Bacteroidota bacterium]